MTCELTVSEYLCEHLPDALTLQIIKDNILQPTNDFFVDYFPVSIKFMLMWRNELFSKEGLNLRLSSKERLQLINLIALCRLPVQQTYLAEIKEPFPSYNNDDLHQFKKVAQIKEKSFPNFSFYDLEFLVKVLPKKISKTYLADKCFESVSKTSRLVEKHFTHEVLEVFSIDAEKYRDLKTFNELQRLQIIGLICYFQIPIKRSVLNISSSM